MFDWLTKRKNTLRNTVLSQWSCFISQDGITWSNNELGHRCGEFAELVLDQLESEGYACKENDQFFIPWHSIFDVIAHPDYQSVLSQLAIPETKQLRAELTSQGSLLDSTFKILINGWLAENNLPITIQPKFGPVWQSADQLVLLSEENYQLTQAIAEFYQNKANADQHYNHRYWGLIRRLAVAAGAKLDQFLLRSVVLTPDKINLELRRSELSKKCLIEVIPEFADCPVDWLQAFDERAEVSDVYNISTESGIVQILPSPDVKTILREIKKMPNRRVAGAAAEAFITNPIAYLGETAAQCLDLEQFEKARVAADLEFDRFFAAVSSEGDEVLAVGLTVMQSMHAGGGEILFWFQRPEQLDGFLEQLTAARNGGRQLFLYDEFEFELFGDSYHEQSLLFDANQRWKSSQAKISASDIYNLENYSDRIAEIGEEKRYSSPFIEKPSVLDTTTDDLNTPRIGVTDSETGEFISVPATPQSLQHLAYAIAEAELQGDPSIRLLDTPKSLPLPDAVALVKTLSAYLNGQEVATGDGTTSVGGKPAPNEKTRRKGLVLKANIESLSYLEQRKQLQLSSASTAQLPKALKSSVELKSHQHYGIAWLQNLYLYAPHTCRGALLADDMGLGKTLQLLTFLHWVFESNTSEKPALVVAPVSLLENWQQEISRFFESASLKLCIAYGKSLQEMRVTPSGLDDELRGHKFLRKNWVGDSQLVLTTYETLRDYEFSFAAQQWSVMICDEAQKIKNPNAMLTRSAQKQNVTFKIACTGTPVENSLSDLWCLFDFIQPGFLGALNEFGRKYQKPIETKTDEDRAKLDELRQLVEPQILRRIKADVAKDLKAKIFVPDCKKLPMSEYQLGLYRTSLSLFNNQREESPFKNHLTLLQHLRAICSDPAEYGCTTSIDLPIKEIISRSPKMAWLIEQLKDIQQKKEKVIVFCEFRSLQLIIKRCIEHFIGFKADIINGDTETSVDNANSRQKRIARYSAIDGFAVIILSPVAVGYGVNIQAANHVIHFTRTWNPAKEDQATDRAYRIGQTKDVFVYTPIVVGNGFISFEQKLDELLEYKRQLAGDILNGASDVDWRTIGIGEISPPDVTISERPFNKEHLEGISPKHLEALAALYYARLGFSQVFITSQSDDKGVDVVAIKGQEGILAQCKSSKSANNQLGWDAIRDVVGGTAHYQKQFPGVNFKRACFSNRMFNSSAVEQGQLNSVELIDQHVLEKFIAEHNLTFTEIERLLRH